MKQFSCQWQKNVASKLLMFLLYSLKLAVEGHRAISSGHEKITCLRYASMYGDVHECFPEIQECSDIVFLEENYTKSYGVLPLTMQVYYCSAAASMQTS